MKLSVIVPVHNEHERIDTCALTLLNFLNDRQFWSELIFVENGSEDDTWEKVNWWARQVRPTDRAQVFPLQVHARSKALAVRAGVLASHGDLVYMADCDLSTPAREITRFLDAIDRADIVIGSRRVDGARVCQSRKRELVGRVFHGLTRQLVPFQDTQCGFKMFRRNAALTLFDMLTVSSMAFDVELLVNALRCGYSVVEIPVTWVENETSRVRLVRDSLQMLKDVVALRIPGRQFVPVEG